MSGAGKHCRSKKVLDLYAQIVFAGEFIFDPAAKKYRRALSHEVK